jgi:pantoate--beta-alanine ligase
MGMVSAQFDSASRMLHDPQAMRRAVLEARAAGRRVGFVPTMGALHDGHTSLVEAAAAECDDVAVSIFVNPLQFGPDEDFARYPRPLAADLALLQRLGVRWILRPDETGLFPDGATTRVVVDGPALGFEGRLRPGHFTGVATVVCRLMHAVPADLLYLGAKDWQQTLVVRRMVRDLGLPVDVRVCPTVREADGLAMSSRNAYLDPQQRRQAAGLFEALARAEEAWVAGAAVPEIEAAMRHVLAGRGIEVDYAAVVDADSLEPTCDGPAVALVAGRLGTTRLIDNRPLAARPRSAPRGGTG